MLRMENLYRLVGFDERQTATLVSGKPLKYAGELYSVGGTQMKIHDRNDRVSSGERHNLQNEVSPCHRQESHCRMVQGTVREIKVEHTTAYSTAK